MKVYKIGIIFLVLLILSMGVTCAQDLNQTDQDTLETTEDDALSLGKVTYTDLENQIKTNTNESIQLESDFKYDVEKDGNTTVIELNNKSLTIEGNNKIIDGNNHAGFLKIREGSNLTVKNLLIRNCSSSSVIVSNSVLTLINVSFENNYDQYDGSDIYAYKSKVFIDSGSFKSDIPANWALIRGEDAYIDINNSIFANTTSKYATAIYNTYQTVIKKSKFINLHANLTAGVIAIKPSSLNTTTAIIDCEFINVSSVKNGGALFLDLYANSDGKLKGNVIINNTIFNNCSSEFGGAILQLGGSLEIYNSQFINNGAEENGGAIYTSNVELLIDNSNFTGNVLNEVDGFGGAIFFDYGNLTVTKSNFKDNTAGEGGAIYIYDSKYSIRDSVFESNKDDIRSYFDRPNSIISNCGTNLNKTTNATKSEFMVRFNGIEYKLNPTIVNANVTDSYFNLNDLGLVTPVKNQGSMGACWAFGAAGAFESAFLKATGITLDISENNIQNMGLLYSLYGNKENSEAGTYYTSTGYFLSWLGAINTTDDVYDELGKISSLRFSPDSYRIVDAIFINVSDRDAIKEALIKYGALNLFVYGANAQDSSYNTTHKSVYNSNKSGNHYVTLVGWNDTFSKNLFTKTPQGDGAWICKNSWGTDWGDEGFYYLSYYDASLKESDAVGFIIENTERYDKLYQIEVGGLDSFNNKFVEYEDVFVAEGGSVIAAVGTYFEKANTPYTISIYAQNHLVYTQNGIVNRAGYSTIKLNQYVGIEDNTVFSVRIKSSSTPILSDTRQQLLTNNSYVMQDGNLLYLSDSVAPIKVYAYNTYLVTKNIAKSYDGKEVIFTVEEADDNVTIKFNGQEIPINITDRKGNVSLGVLGIGEYDVTVYYRNQNFTNHISVKSSINTGGVTSVTIGYNTKLTISTTFLDSNANPLVNTEISVKFDGENVKGLKTDDDGNLDVVIYAGNSIGTHYLDLTNPLTGDSVRITVNIVSRFSGNSNVDMYYFDGHAFKVRVKDNFGKFVGKNEIVTIKIGKKTFTVKTDANGYASLKIPNTIVPGKYNIYTTYFGQTVKNTLKVKQVLKLSSVKVKKSAKKLVLKATLKQGKKALKSKKVTFKFNGKKYTAKTNKKGLAKVTIKKNVLKKLKVGKKVKYQVTYLKNTVKKTSKVKK
ncbi:C1 family peptidase [Methanobrevibacter sp.]